MSTAATKNLLLSQPKAGQGEMTPTPTLPYVTVTGEKTIEHKVEIPGVDPSTVEVEFEGSNVAVRCERGRLTLPVSPTVDTSKIKADILWGVLTLTVPVPAPPVAHSIKISIHDAVKKAPAKVSEED